MFSPFRSRASIVATIGINIGLLLLPLVVGLLKSPLRDQAWSSIDSADGPVGTTERVIAEDKGDADILFVGSSTFVAGIELDDLRTALSKKLGRPVRIRMIAVFHGGEDVLYFMLRDYLQRHSARLILVSDLTAQSTSNEPHSKMAAWLRQGDYPDAFKGLGLFSQLQVYSSLVIGAPRQILSIVRPDRLSATEKMPGALAESVHAIRYQGYAGSPLKPMTQYPPPPNFDGFMRVTSPMIHVEGSPSSYPKHFIEEIGELGAQKHVTIGFLHMANLAEFGKDYLPEIVDYSKILGPSTIMIGVPFDDLFRGYSRSQDEQFCSDILHFNVNGAHVFTRAITPGIFQAYQDAKLTH